MDERPIVTVDDLEAAAWHRRTGARATGKSGPFTIELSECVINGATVRGSITTWADGKTEVLYEAHGQTVDSLEAVAALLSGRWIAGDSIEARDD